MAVDIVDAMRITLLLLLSILLFSCSSLPLPHSSTESLFVLPYRIDKTYQNGQKVIKSVTLHLTYYEISEANETLVELLPGDSYTTIALNPGAIMITRVEVQLAGVEKIESAFEHEFSYAFFIGESTVQLSREQFVLRAVKNAQEYAVQTSPFPRSSLPARQILDNIRRDKNWPAWKWNKKINLPEITVE